MRIRVALLVVLMMSAVPMTVTEFELLFATYTSRSSGVTTTPSGPLPTGMVGPAVRVRVSTGVTVASE